MSVVSLQKSLPRAVSRSSSVAPTDPRRLLAAAMMLSLVGLGLVPHVAEAWNGLAPTSTLRSPAGTARCQATEIVDGDTVTLACPGRIPERTRLTGFDTPELFSSKCRNERSTAARAKAYLGRLIGRADNLGVVRKGRDRYGRALVALTVDGRSVADEMIEAGLARPYDGGRRRGWCGESEPAPERGTSAKWVRVGG
jgi:endonuclease YncB( thermonuclease family)